MNAAMWTACLIVVVVVAGCKKEDPLGDAIEKTVPTLLNSEQLADQMMKIDREAERQGKPVGVLLDEIQRDPSKLDAILAAPAKEDVGVRSPAGAPSLR